MSHLDDDLLQELLNTFYDEAADHMQTINKSLLLLERGEDPKERKEHLQNAFRAAHSLKGASRAVSQHEVETLAHAMENILQQARDEGRVLDADTCDILYLTLDSIEKTLGGTEVEVASLYNRLSELINDEQILPDDVSAAAEPQTAIATPNSAKSALPDNSTSKGFDQGSGTDETIRVSVGKLDDLIAQVGELLVSKIGSEQRLADIRSVQQAFGRWLKSWKEMDALISRQNGHRSLYEASQKHGADIDLLAQELNGFVQTFSRDTMRLSMVTDDLQDKVRRVRMVPFQTIILGLERTVRDAAHSQQKELNFVVTGSDVEVDKRVLESLKDALLHLLRNAVTHGIEDAQTRAAAGKDRTGKVSLSVQQRGSEVHIQVADDGRGFDLVRLREISAQRGHTYTDDNADEVIDVAFLPGVSTAQQVTELAGRGVGLDVVRMQLEEVQGRIEVQNMPGRGVIFSLVVPTSLAMTRELMVEISSEFYAIPLQAVEKIVVPDEMHVVGGRLVMSLDGLTYPAVQLGSILERAQRDDTSIGVRYAVIIAVADQRIGLLVDNVLTEQELAVKTLSWPLHRVRNVSGVALLGDGQPVMILNPVDLVRSAQGVSAPLVPIVQSRGVETETLAHVLVVDDSITTRTLEKNILQAAGFIVSTATNGVEALEKLHDNSIEIVVSDVQMPEMDGIVLTQAIKQSSEFGSLPVILVTSLESPRDREQGMLAGADAYIVKRGFDQAELLTTINQLLNKRQLVG